MRMEGVSILETAERLGLNPDTVSTSWKAWQKSLGMGIRDDLKREAVRLIDDGLSPDQAAAETGIPAETVVRQWKKWQQEIREELPDYLRAYTRTATEAEASETALSDRLTAATSPGVGGEKGAEDGEAAEMTEPEKETEKGADGMAEKKNGLDETIGLIRAVDELLTGYLSGGKTVQTASILVDDGNWFELMLSQTEEGRRQAQLSVRVTLEGEEDV